MGRWPARAILYPITLYYLLFSPAQCRASRRYLTRVLEREPNLKDLARHIHCFASTILDRVYFMTSQFDRFNIHFVNRHIPRQFTRSSRGFILLGSHFGSFEVLRTYASKKQPMPIRILMYEGQNPMIVQVLNALNPELSEMVIPLQAPDCLLQVRDALDRGSAVGMLGDRTMDNKKEKTVQCRLLGETVTLPAASILIAAAVGVPVVVFFGVYKGGNRYELHFELLAEKIRLDRGDKMAQIQQWMQKYVDILEYQMRTHPYNWFNFYDYWHDE